MAPPSEEKIPKKIDNRVKDPIEVHTTDLIDSMATEFDLTKAKSKLMITWLFDSIGSVSRKNADH